MIIDVTNEVVLITGASRGIGREMARTFARENARVVLNYFHSEKEAFKLYEEISSYNEDCMLVKADITKSDKVHGMYKQVMKKYGKVDVLINNAGLCSDNLLPVMKYEQFYDVVNVNLFGTFLCSKIFSKDMIRKKRGRIINIASLKGIEGCVGQVNYSSSKGAVISFTKTCAKELGKYNIMVNAVCPNYIKTDLNRKNIKKEEIAKNKNLLDYRYGMDDLMNFLVYLSSDKCNGVSGRVFKIDSRIA